FGSFAFAVSGPDGSYQFSGLVDGDFAVYLMERPAEWAAAAVRATVRDGKAGRAPDLLLTTGGLLDVTVVDDAGKPLEGFYVTADGPDHPEGALDRLLVKSDSDGRLRLRLAPGKSLVWVTGPLDPEAGGEEREPPYRKVEISLRKGETKKLELRTDGKRFAAAV